MLNELLAMSTTFQKFCFLRCLRAKGNNFAILGCHAKTLKAIKVPQPVGNASHAKTYPGIFNISVSISIELFKIKYII